MRKLLLLACLLGACRSAPQPAPTDADPPAEPLALPAQWLVWTTTDSGPRTELIDASGAVLGSTEGAWIGAPDGAGAKLWEFDRELVPTQQIDCDCEMEAMNAGTEKDCRVQNELEIGVLRSFPTGPVVNIPADGYADNDTRAVYGRLDGTVGPYAFTTACLEQYACGAAHGGTTCLQTIYDLRTGAKLEPHDMAADALAGPGMLEFVREAYEDEHEAAEIQSEDVVLSWVAPLYEGALVPRMEEQYTGPACYACSDGMWDSYTISSRRTVEAVPASVAAWLEDAAPPPIESGSRPTLGGWSPMPSDADVRDHFSALLK